MIKYGWQTLFAISLVFMIWLIGFGWRLPSARFNVKPQDATLPVVLGNSMAPTLFGAHHEAFCSKCGYRNRFVDESFPAAFYYCGSCRDLMSTPAFTSKSGDAVMVEPPNNLQRWDIVLVRDPSETMRILKRLVAFPGETLQIKQGDLWIDGQRVDRTLDQIMESRLLVYEELGERLLRPIPTDTTEKYVGWRDVPKNATSESRPSTKQIEFTYSEPWKKTETPEMKRRLEGAIVSDWYPENPAFSGFLWPVSDQILELCFVPERDGELQVALRDSRLNDPTQVWLQEWQSSWNAMKWNSFETKLDQPKDLSGNAEKSLRYLFAYVDGAFWMRAQTGRFDSVTNTFMPENTLLEWKKTVHELFPPRYVRCDADSLWEIEFSGIKHWQLRRLSRDIYYRGDVWNESRSIPFIRDVEGYYLLGDNQPISLDSREKREWINGVPKTWIEGRIRPQN